MWTIQTIIDCASSYLRFSALSCCYYCHAIKVQSCLFVVASGNSCIAASRIIWFLKRQCLVPCIALLLYQRLAARWRPFYFCTMQRQCVMWWLARTLPFFVGLAHLMMSSKRFILKRNYYANDMTWPICARQYIQWLCCSLPCAWMFD